MSYYSTYDLRYPYFFEEFNPEFPTPEAVENEKDSPMFVSVPNNQETTNSNLGQWEWKPLKSSEERQEPVTDVSFSLIEERPAEQKQISCNPSLKRKRGHEIEQDNHQLNIKRKRTAEEGYAEMEREIASLKSQGKMKEAAEISKQLNRKRKNAFSARAGRERKQKELEALRQMQNDYKDLRAQAEYVARFVQPMLNPQRDIYALQEVQKMSVMARKPLTI